MEIEQEIFALPPRNSKVVLGVQSDWLMTIFFCDLPITSIYSGGGRGGWPVRQRRDASSSSIFTHNFPHHISPKTIVPHTMNLYSARSYYTANRVLVLETPELYQAPRSQVQVRLTTLAQEVDGCFQAPNWHFIITYTKQRQCNEFAHDSSYRRLKYKYQVPHIWETAATSVRLWRLSATKWNSARIFTHSERVLSCVLTFGAGMQSSSVVTLTSETVSLHRFRRHVVVARAEPTRQPHWKLSK